MTWGVWREALVAVVCAGMASVAAPAIAGPPVESSYEGTDIFCYGESADAWVELGGFFSPGGELEYGFGGVFTEESGVWVADATGALDAGEFTLALDLVDDEGETAGTVELDGTTMPAGDPLDIDERWRDGNAQTRVSGTAQDLAVEGGIASATGSLEDLVEVDLTCMGAALDITEWSTNPATRVFRSTFSSGFCAVGEDGFLSVDVWGDEAYGSLATGFDEETGAPDFIAEGPLSYEAPSISGALQVLEPLTEPAEFVQISLAVGDIIDRGMDRWKWRSGANHQRYVLREMSGSATGPAGEQFVLTECIFADYTMMDRYSSRAGQKPGGRAPMNDLPDDALALSDSATEKVSTRGAAVPPEAPCVIGDGSEEWEVPFGRTVWYTFEGTGSDVTLSTSGSGFDTVMGVYDAELSQVSCVDDVWTDEFGSLEAEVTVLTDLGAVYLVQVGGFDTGDLAGPEWGNVVLTRN